MLRHTDPRPWSGLLLEMARETVWCFLLQPILPLWYVLGRRMGSGEGTPVVFVHGYMQNRVDFLGIASALRRASVGPLYGFNYPWMLDIATCARRLERFLDRVRRETGKDKVDL